MSVENDLERVLVSEEEINSRISELADKISRDYSEVESLLLISILRGAFIFTADLARQLTVKHSVDFIAVASYQKSTSSGEVRMISDLRQSIEGRHVLIVEDIVDSGMTLEYLSGLLRERNPASVKSCVMVAKKGVESTGSGLGIDYLGFVIPDVWVIGYGLDYDDQYRTLPYIAELKSGIYQNENNEG
jgi:hypoxanthine phosphoribosyltransferase